MADGDQAIRDVVKGAGVIYVGLFLELLIAFVAQVLAARYLSVGDFGGLTAGTALLDIGAIVAGLGFASGLTRYFPRLEPGQRRTLASIVIAVTTLTSVTLGALVALNAGFIAADMFGNPNVEASIRIFGAAIPFATLLNVIVGGIRGQERSLYWVIVKNFAQPITRITLVVAAVLYGLGQAGIAGAYAIPYVISALIGLLLLFRTLPPERTALNRGVVDEITRYSVPFILSGISGFIYRSLDIFLVLFFLGDVATGVYGVAYAAVSFMGMLSTAFNFLGAPIASRLEDDGALDYVARMFQSMARWLTIGSVCLLVPLGVFSAEFITVIYQSRYAEGGLALAVLAVGFGIKNVLSIHTPILESVGRSKTLSVNSTVAAVTNLALNLLLIPRLGIVGAALATVVSFVVRDGLAAIQVYRALDWTPLVWRALRPLVIAVPFLAAVVTVVAPRTPTTFLWLVAVASASALVYVVAVLVAFGLSETDVMIIRSAEERFGLKTAAVDWLIRRLANR
jgi:O-antigen/teichoic acid export membrane protein